MEVGIDIVQIKRIALALQRGAFLSRAFTANEIEYYISNGGRAETLAGIFAAKEAIIKAAELSILKVRLAEIEILHHPSGKPIANFLGSIGKLLNGYKAKISISHDGDYAVAIAYLEKYSIE